MGAVTAEAADPAVVLVSVDLPPGTVEVPVPVDPALDAAAADHVLAALHPDLAGPERDELAARYATLVAGLRDAGTLVAALTAAPPEAGTGGSLLTVDVRPLGETDPLVAVHGLLAVQRGRTPPPAELDEVALPSGPAVVALHRRTWVLGGDVPVAVPFALVELMVPLVEHGLLAVLEVHCPVPGQVEQLAALAGSVAASLRCAPFEEQEEVG